MSNARFDQEVIFANKDRFTYSNYYINVLLKKQDDQTRRCLCGYLQKETDITTQFFQITHNALCLDDYLLLPLLR